MARKIIAKINDRNKKGPILTILVKNINKANSKQEVIIQILADLAWNPPQNLRTLINGRLSNIASVNISKEILIMNKNIKGIHVTVKQYIAYS